MAKKHLCDGQLTACGGTAPEVREERTTDASVTNCADCLWSVLRELRRQESMVLGYIRQAERESKVEVINPIQRG